MAFGRRRRFSRGRFMRRRRRFGGRMNYRTKFIRKTKMHSGTMRPELKYFDPWDASAFNGGTPTAITFTTAGNFCILNNVPEGPSAYNRIGRRINMSSINIHISIYPAANSAVNTAQETYRILLVYDKQPNGNFPANSDLLGSTISTGAQNTTNLSPLNLNNRDRFLILRDWRWSWAMTSNVDPANTSAVSTVSSDSNPKMPRDINWYIKLKGAETTFSTTATPVNSAATITTGTLFLVFLGDARGTTGTSVGSTNCMSATLTARLRFYD